MLHPGSNSELAAFQGNDSLLEELVQAAGALVAAETRLMQSDARAAAARAAAAAARAAIAAADAAGADAEATLASKAPAMLARVRALLPALAPAAAACERVLPLVDGEVVGVLNELSVLVARGSAARDLAPLAAAALEQHARASGALGCLLALVQAAGEALGGIPGLEGALIELAAGEQQHMQQQGVGQGPVVGVQQLQRQHLDAQVQMVHALLQAMDGPVNELQGKLGELGQVRGWAWRVWMWRCDHVRKPMHVWPCACGPVCVLEGVKRLGVHVGVKVVVKMVLACMRVRVPFVCLHAVS